LAFAALSLTAIAWQRSAEYDEQYTLFLTGRVARPVWPTGIVTSGEVQALQQPQAGLSDIARELRATDVHPPLYFWAIAGWRRLAGASLFAARVASVMCSVATLGLVAAIARTAGISAISALLLTLGCYGFAYTGVVARGIALAQLLSVAGILVLLRSRHPSSLFAAGLLMGAATFANYLAGFVACAALLHACLRPAAGEARLRSIWTLLIGCVAWLPADLWFLAVQQRGRPDQFEPFALLSALVRLARYQAAAVFGGLPLYVDGFARHAVTMALAGLILVVLTAIVRRWRGIAVAEIRMLFGMAAMASPIGLLLLGLIADNTPIELRYLAFGAPYVGLLLAAALPQWLRVTVLTVQAAALLGLMSRAETMQPARAAAKMVASVVETGVVLLPRGNDGVGIVGAFAVEAPPALRLLVIGSDATPWLIRARAVRFPSATVALLEQDGSSRATVRLLRAAFDDPCWRETSHTEVAMTFERTCALEE
jgi:uncharacterized membrane protein